MTCKEAEKLIPLFLKDDLDTEELRDFLEHTEHCGECKEELTIQYLVSEGLSRLEQGSVFDLNRELKARIDGAEHVLRRRERWQGILYGLEAMTALEMLTLLALLIFLK